MKYSLEIDAPVTCDPDKDDQITEAGALNCFQFERSNERHSEDVREIRVSEAESGSRVSIESVLFMLTAIIAGWLATCWYVDFLETLEGYFNR